MNRPCELCLESDGLYFIESYDPLRRMTIRTYACADCINAINGIIERNKARRVEQ